jgi:hypothetical protein
MQTWLSFRRNPPWWHARTGRGVRSRGDGCGGSSTLGARMRWDACRGLRTQYSVCRAGWRCNLRPLAVCCATRPRQRVQMSDSASDSDAAPTGSAPCRGLAGPVAGGCWQGALLHVDFWKTLGYGAPNGRRCTAAAPDRAWGPMGQQLGLPAALTARASPDRPPRGAHTELRRSAALTLLPTLSLSPKRMRQPQPPADAVLAAPDLATVDACCCRPHTLDRLRGLLLAAAHSTTPAGPHPQCHCRRPCSANYALRRRG